MTRERLPQVAATGVDFISMGALTHSAPAVDIHLRLGARNAMSVGRGLRAKALTPSPTPAQSLTEGKGSLRGGRAV